MIAAIAISVLQSREADASVRGRTSGQMSLLARIRAFGSPGLATSVYDGHESVFARVKPTSSIYHAAARGRGAMQIAAGNDYEIRRRGIAQLLTFSRETETAFARCIVAR